MGATSFVNVAAARRVCGGEAEPIATTAAQAAPAAERHWIMFSRVDYSASDSS